MFSSFLLICALSLIGIQKCHGVLKAPLPDNIIVSALTPVDKYGKIDYNVIPKLAQYYKDNNLKIVYVAGYYGGAPSVPLRERKRLVEAWSKFGFFDLVVEVGLMPFVDTLELVSYFGNIMKNIWIFAHKMNHVKARYCRKFNISAITAFPELVYQASTLDEALEDLQRICDASSNIPLLYNELVTANEKIRAEAIVAEAKGGRVSCLVGGLTSVDTFLSTKSSVYSVAGYQLWSYGLDSISAAIKLGMNVTETTNLFPDLIMKIRDAVDNCDLDLATDLQQELDRRVYAITNPFGGIQDVNSRKYIAREKAGFELLTGIPVGYRYPLVKPNSTELRRIRTNLKRLGVKLYNSDN